MQPACGCTRPGEVKVSYPFLGMGIALKVPLEEQAGLREMLQRLAARASISPANGNPNRSGPAATLPTFAEAGEFVKRLARFFDTHSSSLQRRVPATCLEIAPKAASSKEFTEMGVDCAGIYFGGGACNASLPLVFALTFILGAAGCGNVFVGGAINTQTISGTVSIVQLTVPRAEGYDRPSHRCNACSQWHGLCRYVLR